MAKEYIRGVLAGVGGLLAVFPVIAQVQAPEQAVEASAPAAPESASSAAAPAAPAQQAADEGPAISEVIVTARKRAESIQSVPLAVTAVSGEMLERANITDVNSLGTQVPSLVIVPGSSGSKAIPTFAIRGQSQQELTILADPSVPIYFNDVVIERPQGMNQALFDIQSVEVLKGPQGTLFGRNSTGGAINIKANTPSKEFEGYIGGMAGNLGRLNSTMMVNQPLTDWAQLRFAAQTTDSDGYLKDVVLNQMVNDEHTKSARLSLALQPIEGMNSLFTYSRFIEDDGGTGSVLYKVNPGSVSMEGNPGSAFYGYTGPYSAQQALANQQAMGIYKMASGVDQYTRISTWDLANTTTYEFNDRLSIKNIVGSRSVTGGNYDDTDAMPIPFFQIARKYDFDQFSEELQLLGNTDTLNWIVGLYYFKEKGGTDDYSITVKPVNASPGNQIPQPEPWKFPGWSLTDPDGENTSKSIFAQGTQKLNALLNGLSLTLGARYTWDDRTAIVRNRSGGTDPNGPQTCRVKQDDGTPYPIDQCEFRNSKSFSEPTYNVSLDYQYTPRNLVYLAHRRGYRTGGFGARADTAEGLAKTYNAETVTDFELGTKNDWRIGPTALRVNLAVFHSNYTDIQRLLTDPNLIPITTVPVNAGKATINGGELEFTFLPFSDLELSGFWSYTDAKYDEFDRVNSDGSVTDISSQPFARAPKSTYSFTARYTVPISSDIGDISMQANYFHTDHYSPSDSYSPEQNVKGYGLLNIRADWKSIWRSGFDVGLFADNLLDKEYLLPFSDLYTTSSIGVIARTPGSPRTYGVDFRYRFGAAR
ncbi:MAG: TonB-dependent receptor [Solimonas sp.]